MERLHTYSEDLLELLKYAIELSEPHLGHTVANSFWLWPLLSAS